MNSRLRLYYGFELECALGGGAISIGNYHSGHRLGVAGIRSEEDGSLSAGNLDYTVELISGMFELNEFWGIWEALGAKLKDSEVEAISTNSSCGLHLHFSPVSCRKNAHNGISYAELKGIRELWAKRVKAKFPEHADAILAHYNRNYATVQPDLNHMRNAAHHAEFNIYEGKGVEWRSFNARGVGTGRDGQFEKDFHRIGEVVYEGLLVVREVLSKTCGRGYLFATKPKRVGFRKIEVGELNAADSVLELPLNIKLESRAEVREVECGSLPARVDARSGERRRAYACEMRESEQLV